MKAEKNYLIICLDGCFQHYEERKHRREEDYLDYFKHLAKLCKEKDSKTISLVLLAGGIDMLKELRRYLKRLDVLNNL